MDYSQFLSMPQEIGLLGVFLLVFLYDTFLSKKAQNALPLFTCVAFGIFTIANVFLCDANCSIFGGMFVNTSATVAIKAILNIGMLIVLIQSVKWANSEYMTVRRGEFYELLLLTLFGMYFMISARHFLMFVIGLETASLPLAALIAFEKNRYESHEAAAKYLFTAIFSSALFMMGLSFVYALAGSLYFSDIAAMVTGEQSTMLIIALAFVIAGVGFKLSLVPFHLWTADVYQGAPTPVTGYLSVISKGAAAFAFMVILTQVFGSLYTVAWKWMLYALIVLTITLGNLFAIRQRNMKRFLAFSSVSQAGYIMLGVVAANEFGLASLMYYVLVYVLSNLAAFAVIGAIENKTGKVMMSDYDGLRSTNPWLSFAMMLAMFSLAGIPPFAGFFSKFFIFAGALSTGNVALYVLVFIALLNTIISLYYYLLVVKAMFINKPGEGGAIETFKSSCTERTAMVICVLGIMLVGIISCIYGFLVEAAAGNVIGVF